MARTLLATLYFTQLNVSLTSLLLAPELWTLQHLFSASFSAVLSYFALYPETTAFLLTPIAYQQNDSLLDTEQRGISRIGEVGLRIFRDSRDYQSTLSTRMNAIKISLKEKN